MVNVESRIEAVRAFFELADNWPTEPFPLAAGSAWVFEPNQFIHGHLDLILSGKDAALVLPYLERLEGLMRSKKQPSNQEPITSKQ